MNFVSFHYMKIFEMKTFKCESFLLETNSEGLMSKQLYCGNSLLKLSRFPHRKRQSKDNFAIESGLPHPVDVVPMFHYQDINRTHCLHRANR